MLLKCFFSTGGKKYQYLSGWHHGDRADFLSACICACALHLCVYSLTSNTFHDLHEQRANGWSLTHEIPPSNLKYT